MQQYPAIPEQLVIQFLKYIDELPDGEDIQPHSVQGSRDLGMVCTTPAKASVDVQVFTQ